MVFNDCTQIFVDGRDGYHLQVGNDLMEHKLVFTTWEGVGKQLDGLAVVEQTDGHQQHIAVNHDGGSLRQLHKKIGGLESLAQVGSHRHPTLHHVG